MSIWGAVIGGTAGFFLGGPLGGLLGAVAGHAVGKAKAEMAANRTFDDQTPVENRQAAFAVAVIVLGAKMAKADGIVTKDEVAAFKEVFHVPEDETARVGNLFNEAKRNADGFEPFAHQIAGIFRNEPQVLEEILGGLFHIAKADNVIHPAELHYLRSVAAIFGFSEAAFETIRARHVPAPGEDPYEILGVSHSDDDDAIKAAYRKLLRENHPDVLMAKGVPQEFIDVANKKMATINAAYDEISAQRGLK